MKLLFLLSFFLHEFSLTLLAQTDPVTQVFMEQGIKAWGKHSDLLIIRHLHTSILIREALASFMDVNQLRIGGYDHRFGLAELNTNKYCRIHFLWSRNAGFLDRKVWRQTF